MLIEIGDWEGAIIITHASSEIMLIIVPTLSLIKSIFVFKINPGNGTLELPTPRAN